MEEENKSKWKILIVISILILFLISFGVYAVLSGKIGSNTIFENLYEPKKVDDNDEVSKEKETENAKIIDLNIEQSGYRKMTMKLDKAIITPRQIAIQLTSEISNVSTDSLVNVTHDDHIGIIEYKVYDENNNELINSNSETKRTIIYEDGTIEEWKVGEIEENKNFKDAKMILKYDISIEKINEIKKIKIVPYVREIEELNDELVEFKRPLYMFEVDLINENNNQDINQSNISQKNIEQEILGTWEYAYSYNENDKEKKLTFEEAHKNEEEGINSYNITFCPDGAFDGNVGYTESWNGDDSKFKIDSNGNIVIQAFKNKTCQYLKNEKLLEVRTTGKNNTDVYKKSEKFTINSILKNDDKYIVNYIAGNYITFSEKELDQAISNGKLNFENEYIKIDKKLEDVKKFMKEHSVSDSKYYFGYEDFISKSNYKGKVYYLTYVDIESFYMRPVILKYNADSKLYYLEIVDPVGPEDIFVSHEIVSKKILNKDTKVIATMGLSFTSNPDDYIEEIEKMEFDYTKTNDEYWPDIEVKPQTFTIEEFYNKYYKNKSKYMFDIPSILFEDSGVNITFWYSAK